MRRRFYLLYLLAFLVMGSACQKNPWTHKVVQPKSHWLPYNQQKHKKRNRTKTVKMKSHRPKNPLFKSKNDKENN